MLEKEKLFKEAENAIKWIKEYVEKIGAKGVVVGNSGGKDSATVIAMATKALGKERIVTVAIELHGIATVTILSFPRALVAIARTVAE